MEGEYCEYATEEFTQAITFPYTEKMDAHICGMHFRDYFPNRELGICYLNLGNRQNDFEKIQKAMDELELSMDQTQSVRAKHYLYIQFTENTTEALREAISNLTEKFHTSFPECNGNIIHKEGEIIHVGMGLHKKILPCIRYNIFEDETDLITVASVRNMRDRTSEAEISEAEKNERVMKGFGLRTR